MTTELYILALAGLLQVAQVALYSVIGNLQIDKRTVFGPRDAQIELPTATGRAHRAMNNHFEGLILFTLAVVVVTLSDQSSTVTELCAHIYLISRLLYIPAYLQGLAPWRSIIWLVGFSATAIMLIAALI